LPATRKYDQHHLLYMADEKSEEFRRFILENRELIETILKEEKEKLNASEKLDQKKEEAKEKAKELNDTVLSVLSDDEVQKHFITGCLEFVHLFEALIKAIPMSPDTREVVDQYEEARDKTVRNIIAVGAKDKMDNINVDEAPKKQSRPKSEKKKVESIPINDVKKKKKTE